MVELIEDEGIGLAGRALGVGIVKGVVSGRREGRNREIGRKQAGRLGRSRMQSGKTHVIKDKVFEGIVD